MSGRSFRERKSSSTQRSFFYIPSSSSLCGITRRWTDTETRRGRGRDLFDGQVIPEGSAVKKCHSYEHLAPKMEKRKGKDHQDGKLKPQIICSQEEEWSHHTHNKSEESQVKSRQFLTIMWGIQTRRKMSATNSAGLVPILTFIASMKHVDTSVDTIAVISTVNV